MAQIENDKEIVLAAPTFRDAAGESAPIDGEPTFASTNPDVLEYVDTGTEKLLKTKAGITGTAEIVCTADVRMGDEVKLLELREPVAVISAEAVGGTINFGTRPRT